MHDGLKLRIRGNDQHRLRTHHLLTWKPNGVDRLGRAKFLARWGDAFIFKGDATRCTLMRGSFHKYYHGGENWKDFTREQFVESVQFVCIALGLHPKSLRLANLEVGVNVIPPIPTAQVLEAIVLHRTQRPNAMRAPAKGLEILHSAYRFKIYDKAFQYKRPGQLLRFEISVRKMRTLERYGVRTLADLMKPETWAALQGYLLARFDELLIVEPEVSIEGLRPAERELVTRSTDPSYWVGLSRRQRSEKRKALADIYARTEGCTLKSTLRSLIASKLQEVTQAHDQLPEHHTGRLHPLPQAVQMSVPRLPRG